MTDLIRRQDAIDAISCNITITGRQNAELVAATIGAFADRIKALPSAEPERKKGKWVEVDDFYNRISGRCSVCGWEAHMYEDDVVGMPFCPFCGADMRPREEGHDD